MALLFLKSSYNLGDSILHFFQVANGHAVQTFLEPILLDVYRQALDEFRVPTHVACFEEHVEVGVVNTSLLESTFVQSDKHTAWGFCAKDQLL